MSQRPNFIRAAAALAASLGALAGAQAQAFDAVRLYGAAPGKDGGTAGLAVIAGLIGGGGFGSFVFQGLNQTAMDLVLLGALPTILLALVAGIGLDLAIRSLGPQGGRAP